MISKLQNGQFFIHFVVNSIQLQYINPTKDRQHLFLWWAQGHLDKHKLRPLHFESIVRMKEDSFFLCVFGCAVTEDLRNLNSAF